MVNTIYLLSFVETPRKFIIAELSIRKLGSSSVQYYNSTDEDPSLRIESSAIINLRGVSTKLNKYNYDLFTRFIHTIYYDLYVHMLKYRFSSTRENLTCVYTGIEDIAWRCEDMNFIFEC